MRSKAYYLEQQLKSIERAMLEKYGKQCAILLITKEDSEDCYLLETNDKFYLFDDLGAIQPTIARINEQYGTSVVIRDDWAKTPIKDNKTVIDLRN
ncbi:hypothetical protein [Enterococcus faecalis]|uniref:hypothetical protein n=1 Tax=Enterococcus faecalis TaxID=1351 RepID=UPI003D0982D2